MKKKENLSQDVITKYQAFMKCFRELKKKKPPKLFGRIMGRRHWVLKQILNHFPPYYFKGIVPF